MGDTAGPTPPTPPTIVVGDALVGATTGSIRDACVWKNWTSPGTPRNDGRFRMGFGPRGGVCWLDTETMGDMPPGTAAVPAAPNVDVVTEDVDVVTVPPAAARGGCVAPASTLAIGLPGTTMPFASNPNSPNVD